MKFSLIFIFIFTVSGSLFGNESIYDETNDLTEADEANSEHYVHGGLAEKEYMKKCVGDDGVTIDEKCMESNKAFNKDDDKFMAGLEEWMPMVSQAYSMFALIPGMNKTQYNVSQNGNPVYKNGDKTYVEKDGQYSQISGEGKDTFTATDSAPEGAKRETKEGQDYCGFIPMVTEAAAMFTSQSQNQQIEANVQGQTGTTSAQADSFYAMADVQKTLRQSSQLQAIGWGTTAACYTTLMLTGVMSPKTSPIIKASAAALLTTYYTKKSLAHNERMKAYKILAEGFPKAGECNPFTRTTCFCMEKTSLASDPTNFQRFCVPKGKHSTALNAVSCITQDLKPDPACACKAKGTCVQARIANIGAQIGLSPTTMSGQFQSLKPFSSGFLGSDFEGTTNKNLAFAKKGISKVKPTKIKFTNNNQKDLTKKLIDAGIPKFGAAKLAITKGTNSLPSSFSRGYSPSRSYSKGKESKSYANTPRFNRGGDAGGSRKSSYSSGRSRRSSTSGGAKSIEIQDFASQAEKQAMERAITRDTSKPIFDIISYRYKTSAWREFREKIQKEMKEVKE
jgi:hypothetical protein